VNEIAVYQPRGEVAAREPHRDIDSWIQVVSDVIKIANVICDTPFVPDGLRGSAPAVAAAILSGREMGLGMMTSLANIDVIKGKPTQKALLMRAMIQAQGHKWADVDVSDTRVVVKGCRRGESEWTEVTFTAAQAKTAGIDLGKYPADKLYARASSRLARRKFADVIMGMPYTPEDLEDGVDDDAIGTVAETAAPPAPAAPDSKPRTAQRKTRTPDAPSAQAAVTPAAAEPRPPAGAGGALPPLPGEEEVSSGPVPSGQPAGNEPAPGPDDTDYDTPGTATDPQVKAIVTILSKSFAIDRDDQQREICAHIANREVKSRKNLSRNQAVAIIDTLSHWQKQAKREGMDPKDYAFAVMAAQEAARAQDAAGEPDGQ